MSHDQTFQMATYTFHHRMKTIHAAKKCRSCFGSLIICCKKMVIPHNCQLCISFYMTWMLLSFTTAKFIWFFQNIWTHGWNSKWSPSQGEDNAGRLLFHEVIRVLENCTRLHKYIHELLGYWAGFPINATLHCYTCSSEENLVIHTLHLSEIA